MLEISTTALCSLLQAQPALLDLIPSMGHIPRLCYQMGAGIRQIAIPKAAIMILNSLSLSSVSQESLKGDFGQTQFAPIAGLCFRNCTN